MSIESFVQTFGEELKTAPEDYFTPLYEKAIECLGRIVRVGECLLYPVTNNAGYAITKVGGKRVTVSRLVQCCATNRRYDYTRDDGEFMHAGHKTEICPHRNCINPDHLMWETSKENTRRREADKRAKAKRRHSVPFAAKSSLKIDSVPILAPM